MLSDLTIKSYEWTPPFTFGFVLSLRQYNPLNKGRGPFLILQKCQIIELLFVRSTCLNVAFGENGFD